MKSQIDVDYHLQRLASIAIITDDRELAKDLQRYHKEVIRGRVKPLTPFTIQALGELRQKYGDMEGDE